MSTNFFDQDDGEFRDQPDEVSGKTPIDILQEIQLNNQPRRAPATPPQQFQAQRDTFAESEYDIAESVEDIIENMEDEDDDYSASLLDAGLRLEQGNLYKIIMMHDLFEGMDFDPKAVKAVTKQIRKFAKEQMEIMLGMRKETSKVESLHIDFPFNQVEVEVLKMVAKTASKGRSENSDAFVPEVKRVTEEVPVIPKRQGLNPIVGAKKAAPVPIKPQPVKAASVQPSALRTQPKAPIARKAASNTPNQVTLPTGEVITKDQIDQTFEPDYVPLTKDVSQMTSDELLERNRQTSERRHKTVKNPQALPMPTFEQEQMLHTMRTMDQAAGGQNLTSSLITILKSQGKL